MDKEFVVNLWAVYDMTVNAIYALSGKVYCVAGSDTEKLNLLRNLAVHDFMTAKRYRVPERFVLSCPDGTERERLTTLHAFNDPNSQLFEEIFLYVEKELPPVFDFTRSEKAQAIKQSLPPNPLCITTLLAEDHAGCVRPIVGEDDREWFRRQSGIANDLIY